MIFMCLIIALIILLYLKETYRPRNFPPGPAWKPFIGNTREVRELSKKLGGLHLAYQYLGQKYNTPILGLKIGGKLTVIINSYNVAREVLTSTKYDGRPDNFFMRLRCLGARCGITCVDGPFWVEQRKFVERNLKNAGYGKIQMENKINLEVDALLEILENSENKSIDFGELVAPSNLNILWTLATGDNLSRDDARIINLLKVLNDRNVAFDMAGGLLNSMPWLRFFIPEQIGYNLIVNLNKRLVEFFRETIEYHHRTWSPNNQDDVIYSFITEMKTNSQSKNFTDHQLLAICLDIFLGGSTTTNAAVNFVFLNLIMHPEVQEKCATDLRTALNMDEPISYADRFKVPYVEAMISEVERIHGIIPLSAPRRVFTDTVLQGYHIKKDTAVFVNFYSVLMDEEYWGDPFVFRPERFIKDNGQLKRSSQFINFGLGKRRCLGEALARQFVFIVVSSILRKFKICKAPDSAALSDQPVPGIILTPRPYKAVLIKL